MPWWNTVLEKAVNAVDKTIDNIEHRRAAADPNQSSTAGLAPGASPVPTASPGEEISAPTSPLVMGPVPGTDIESYYQNGFGADLTNGLPIHMPSEASNGQKNFLTPSMDVIPLDGDGRGVFDFEPRDHSEMAHDDDWNSPTVAAFPYRPRSVVGTPDNSQPASPDNHLRHVFKRQAQRTSSLTKPKTLAGIHSSGSIDEISAHSRLGGFSREFRTGPRRHSVNLPRSLSEELNNSTSAQFAEELQSFIGTQNGTPHEADLGGDHAVVGARGLYKPQSLQHISLSEDDASDQEIPLEDEADVVEGDVSDNGPHSPSWNVDRRNGGNEYSDDEVESEFGNEIPEYENSQYGDSAAHVSEGEDETESRNGEYGIPENPDHQGNGEEEYTTEMSEGEEETGSGNGVYDITKTPEYGNNRKMESTVQLPEGESEMENDPEDEKYEHSEDEGSDSHAPRGMSAGVQYDENEENTDIENKRLENGEFETETGNYAHSEDEGSELHTPRGIGQYDENEENTDMESERPENGEFEMETGNYAHPAHEGSNSHTPRGVSPGVQYDENEENTESESEIPENGEFETETRPVTGNYALPEHEESNSHTPRERSPGVQYEDNEENKEFENEITENGEFETETENSAHPENDGSNLHIPRGLSPSVQYDENEENSGLENEGPKNGEYEDENREIVEEDGDGGDVSSVVTEEESEVEVEEEMGTGMGLPTLREMKVAHLPMNSLRVDLGRGTPDSMNSFGGRSATSAMSHFDDDGQPVHEHDMATPTSPKTPLSPTSPRDDTPVTSVENSPAIPSKPVLGGRLSRPIEDLEPDRGTIQTKEMNNLVFSRIQVLKNDTNSSSDVEVWIEEEVHEKAAKMEGGQPGNAGSKSASNGGYTPDNFHFSFEDYEVRSGNLENEACETDTDRMHKLSQNLGFADPIEFRKRSPTPPHTPTKLHGDRTHVPVLLAGGVETPWGMTGPKVHSVDDISIRKSENSGVGTPGGLAARRGLVSASLDSFQPLSRTRSDPSALQQPLSPTSQERRRSWGSSPPRSPRERYANLEFGAPLSPRGSLQSLSGEPMAEERISEGEEDEEEEEEKETGSEGIAEISEGEGDGEKSPHSFQSEDSVVTDEEHNFHEVHHRNFESEAAENSPPFMDGKMGTGVIREEDEDEIDGDEQGSPMEQNDGHEHSENATPQSEDTTFDSENEDIDAVETEIPRQRSANQSPVARDDTGNDWSTERAVPMAIPAVGVAAVAGSAVLANHVEPRSVPSPIGVQGSNIVDQLKLEQPNLPNTVEQPSSPLVERSAHGVPEEMKMRLMPLDVQMGLEGEGEGEEEGEGEDTDSCDRCFELQNEIDSICQHLQDYPSRMATRRDSTEKSLNELADKERENYIKELEETLHEYAMREGQQKATIDRLDKSMALLMLDANVDPEKEQVISGLMSDLREAEGRLGLLREEMQVKERDLKEAQSTTALLRKMMGELEKTNQAQAAELANNETVLASIGGSIAERAVVISEQAAEIKQHQESAVSLREQLQTAESAVAAAQAAEQDLKARLEVAEEKSKEAAETIESLSVTLAKEQERVTSLAQQVQQIRNELENEVEEGKELKAVVATSEAALLAQTARLHQAEKDVSGLQQKLQQKDSEITEAAKATEKQREIDNMVLELRQERARANHLEDEFNRIIPKKNDEIEELRCLNDENIKLVKWGESIVKDMVATLSDEAKKIKALEGELEEKKKELKLVVADAAEKKVTVRRLQDTVSSLEQRLTLLQSQSSSRDKEYREFRDLAGRLHNDVSSRSEEIQAMRDRERKYKDTLKVLDEVSQTQSREIAALRKQLNSTLESEHELKVAHSKLAAQNDLLKRDQHQSREQQQAMQHEIQHLRQLLLREGVPRHALYSSPPRHTSSPMISAQSPTRNTNHA